MEAYSEHLQSRQFESFPWAVVKVFLEANDKKIPTHNKTLHTQSNCLTHVQLHLIDTHLLPHSGRVFELVLPARSRRP